MKTLQIVKYSLLALVAAAAVAILHYNLPRTDVVQITGTDVKRIDRGNKDSGTRTRDVRYLNAVTRSEKVRVFRNEDTGWGWPPYFKFHSADLTAKAQTILQEPDKSWVRVRYYGWRITILSVFPNAVSIKVVDKDYNHIPAFNIVFLTSLAIAIFFLVRFVRGLGERVEKSEGYQSISASIGKLLRRDKPED